MQHMQRVRKLILYYAACAGTLWGMISAAKLNLDFIQLLICFIMLMFLVIIYIVIEEEEKNKDNTTSVRERCEKSECSFIVTIVESLDIIRYANSYDEQIAERANNIVRKELDKWTFNYLTYKKWRQKNHLVFAAIVDINNELIGFFDIWPLTEYAAERILSGKLNEHDLTERDIYSYEYVQHAKNIYIASIIINKEQNVINIKVAKEIVIIKMYEYIEEKYCPLENKTVIAYAHTKDGEMLLKKAGFTMRLRKKDSVQKRPLYVLEPGQCDAPFSRFKRIKNGILAIGRR